MDRASGARPDASGVGDAVTGAFAANSFERPADLKRTARAGLPVLALTLAFGCTSGEKRVEPISVAAEPLRSMPIPDQMAGESIYDVEWIDTVTVAVVFQPGTSVTLMSWQQGMPHKNLGRNGQGPGEFRLANGTALADSGRIAVLDGNLRKVSFWTRAGIWVRDTPVEAMFVSGIWATDSGIIVATQSMPRSRAELLVVDQMEDRHRVVRRIAFGTDRSRSSCPYCRLAVGRNLGFVSLVADDTLYRLLRFDSAGDSLTPLERMGLERPERTKRSWIRSVAFGSGWQARSLKVRPGMRSVTRTGKCPSRPGSTDSPALRSLTTVQTCGCHAGR
jgi:hypothetical protein